MKRGKTDGLSRKCNMVSMLWLVARSFMGDCWCSMEHHDHWHSDWPTVLQTCHSCIFPIWQGCSIWWQHPIHDCEYPVDDFQWYSVGVGCIVQRFSAMLHNRWNPVWASMLQKRKTGASTFWSKNYIHLKKGVGQWHIS